MESEKLSPDFEWEEKINAGKTDLEKFVELYRGFGIECRVDEGSSPAQNFRTITLQSPDYGTFKDNIATYSERIIGSGYTKLVFTKEGEFIEQGIWE